MIVVKVGGAALEKPDLVSSLAKDLIALRKTGQPVVIVHGGGPSINRALTARGIQWSFIEGQRVTTPEMMTVIEDVLSREVNSSIVRALAEAGVNAVSFSSVQNQLLRCIPSDPRLWLVGKIVNVETAALRALIESDPTVIPVLAPIGVGFRGERYNINADWAACRVAEALSADQLVFFTDQSGILDRNRVLIREIDEVGLEDLIAEGTVQGGMLAKTRTILHALNAGVSAVHVARADGIHPILNLSGTECRKAVVNTESGVSYAYA